MLWLMRCVAHATSYQAYAVLRTVIMTVYITHNSL